MAKKIISVDDDFNISVTDVNDEEFASSDGTHGPEQYAEILKSFQGVLRELTKMVYDEEYRRANASEFVRRHGVWLHNLVKTGFAVDYAQYRRK